MIGLDSYSRQVFIYLDPILIYISLWIDCLFEIRKIAVFLLAFIAGWLQGHWWGFISRNYVVWPTFLLMNVFIALKGSHFWFLLAPGQGQTAPRGQNFDVNWKSLSLYPFVASFKEISLKSDYIQFLHDLIHVYSPGVEGIQPPGDKVLMSTETSYHFGHLLLVSNHRRQ